MIAATDVQSNVFRLADVNTVASFVIQNHLAGVHYCRTTATSIAARLGLRDVQLARRRRPARILAQFTSAGL